MAVIFCHAVLIGVESHMSLENLNAGLCRPSNMYFLVTYYLAAG